MKEEELILFYGTKGDYGFLSNFYPSPFTLEGNQYPTNEHYFQSQKFSGQPFETQIMEAKTPKEAKKLGRKHKLLRLD